MTECYKPPAGFVDQYYMYVWDPPNALTTGQDYLNQSVLMLGGFDFILRRVVGLDTVLEAAPSGKFMIRTMSASNMAAKPLSVGGAAEFQVVPEQFYSSIAQIAFDLYSASAAGGGTATLTQNWCGSGSSITYTAVTPGAAGAAITIRITNGGVSNPPVVSVVGTDITVQTWADGIPLTSFASLVDIANALNAFPAAAALITTTTSGAAATCFPVIGELYPFFPLQFGAVGQIGFGGVRRRRGTRIEPTFKYKHLPFQVQLVITIDWSDPSPRSFYIPFENYDFELWGIQIEDTAGYGTSSAKLVIFDQAHNALSNLPVLAGFLTDSVPWGRPSADRYNIGAIVPPMVYMNQTNFQVDVYSLQPNPVVVTQTLTITLNGAQRIPC